MNIDEKVAIEVRQKYIRISPYKLRRVADVIRGRDVVSALSLLKALPHSGTREFEKLVKSAVASAVHNNRANLDSVFVINSIFVNGGPVGKRFQPKGRGRIYQILKPTSHVVLSVKEV